ncbi:hypothetical protein HMH01_15985 [Halovulum dunhuangense]|uniref:Alpha/beta hydrolase family protein n=1 Tax=Halovulum dunhuangense TaxID=1505036 RepID=A0A849L616_9RHOB|nr:hypothetical protein [Halovulum dunhuangense]NNU81938.1 hypothetical protein [Halovulum dunhuangense]
MTPTHDARVRRRHVLYLPGFDPAGVRRYRDTYVREGARQAGISGYALEVADLPEGNGPGWRVTAQIDGAKVETVVSYLDWSDIVKARLRRPLGESLTGCARAFLIYMRSGAFFGIARVRRAFLIPLLGPYLLVFLVAPLLGLLVAALAGLLVPSWIALAAGIAAAAGFVAFLRARDRRFYVFYLMHVFSLIAERGGATPDLLRPVQAGFAARIREALAGDFDEVLVVGHSAGGHMAVSVVAEVLRGGHGHDGRLALLTVGAVVPLPCLLAGGAEMRADVAECARAEALFWLDVGAPGDGVCMALCDPVAMIGLDLPERRNPLVISAAFHRTLDPGTVNAPGFTFFRRHFQYLCAFDRPGVYDYFRITAGPERLADRFHGQAHSPSRVITRISRYSDIGENA